MKQKLENISKNQQLDWLKKFHMNLLFCLIMINVEQWYFTKIVSLLESFVMRSHHVEFICTTFNKTTHETLHIIANYKPPKIVNTTF
jgi:hypothetical protein